jgi:hypothetical protein
MFIEKLWEPLGILGGKRFASLPRKINELGEECENTLKLRK